MIVPVPTAVVRLALVGFDKSTVKPKVGLLAVLPIALTVMVPEVCPAGMVRVPVAAW